MYRGRRRYRRRRRRLFRVGYDRTGGFYRGKNIGRELKYLDHSQQTAVVIPDNAINLEPTIVNAPQGTGKSARIGQNWVIKSITFRYHALIPTNVTAADNHDSVAIYIIWDKQANGGAPVGAQFLDFDLSGADQSFRNLENVQRFVVLKKITFDLRVAGAAYDGIDHQLFFNDRSGSCHIKCNIPIYSSATDNDLAGIKSNNIAIMAISRHGIVRISHMVRVRFVG